MPAAGARDKTTVDAGIGTTPLASPDAARRALGTFLRRMRDRARPASTRTAPVRRRAAGLRREEVALAAGISVTWYT